MKRVDSILSFIVSVGDFLLSLWKRRKGGDLDGGCVGDSFECCPFCGRCGCGCDGVSPVDAAFVK